MSKTTGPGERFDIRPLDWLRSLKMKLGVLVTGTVFLAAVITWVGLNNNLGPTRTFPLAVILSLLLVQFLARGMTRPLREMIHAARAMAAGDYSIRVRSTSRDEVGALAEAFNSMAAELAEQTQMRRELIANVSHELRTPIAALQAQLENVVDGITEPNPTTMSTALAQTERLGKLVADLLDLSRLESGASALHLAHVDLHAFLTEAVQEAGLGSVAKDIAFTVDVPDGLQVQADEDRLHQVFANLLGNAVRHSPVGGTITLTASAEAGLVIIDVSDEGEGIALADRVRIFSRFERGEAQVRSETGGTGLGLAIVRWAVELHHGSVDVVDSPRGATFRVRLPVTQAGTEADNCAQGEGGDCPCS